MKLVGLTGGIATGKSAVADMFRRLGATLIDSDLLAREVVEPGKPAYNDIVKRFGSAILNADGTMDREKLGGIVFKDDAARKDLNTITHPRVFELMTRRIKEAGERGAEVVIVDIPLLFETGISWFENVILVYAKPETQLKRLMDRDKCDSERALARINSQMPIEEKRKKASIVIDNSGSIEETSRQARDVWKRLRT